jgi:hypothetical protein
VDHWGNDGLRQGPEDYQRDGGLEAPQSPLDEEKASSQKAWEVHRIACSKVMNKTGVVFF